jgi:hypothetical protein
MKTEWLIWKRKTATPAKKRNRERCIRVGNPSTTQAICIFSAPVAKNARIRARFSGLQRAG